MPNLLICRRILAVHLLAFAIVAGLFPAADARADMITFNSIPGIGTPYDGLAIGSQFAASTGMSFSLEGGGLPVIASVGGSNSAFTGYGGLPNEMAPGQTAGPWFITDDGLLNLSVSNLLVSYSTPQSAVGGEILDLDGTEAWRIEAYDSAHSLLDTIVLNSSSSGTGDGIATPWEFHSLLSNISLVRLVYIGGYQHNIGVAFDNFWSGIPTGNPTIATPEPGTLTLLGTGVLALGIPVWRRRTR